MILQLLVGAFILSLDVVGLNILKSILSTAKEYQWRYIESLSSSRLSWKKTAVFCRLYLYIPKRDTRQLLETYNKLWLRWCFSLLRN